MSTSTGRVAVVTGAGQGLGRAIARDLGAAGHTVFGCAMREAPDFDGVRMIACDVTDEAQVQALWDRVIAEAGRVDWWINNAGLALTGRPLAGMGGDEFARMVAVNLVGTMTACRVAIAGMTAQGGGEVWNMLGAGADGQPVPGMNGYATSKAALTFMTRALAAEAEGQPYRIGGFSPGLVMTEGFFREHARVPDSQRAAREAVVNLIGDHPETLAVWIREALESGQDNGAILTWLTPEKIAERRAEQPPRDILSAYR
ncbi:SDR family oxidoreductase [Novosphingobium resinovorum]|uniref:SDR family oxidoreductase n=1 Tax=Novosphingobium resinovorum TaxID=158500 RepID=UPI002ED5DCC7|nr:SDR family oxidoreductase [Novosphingobium resinovorum]